MSQPTLPWPNLSAYNLLLTVNHDKAGNRALVLRPNDPEESSERTTARLNILAPKIDQFCQKIGNGQIKSRVLRDQYLVFTGPLVNNQALINRFFGRLFPKSSTMLMTLAQAESAEVVRKQAMALFNKDKVGPNTALDNQALIQALPSGVDFQRTDSGCLISVLGQPGIAVEMPSSITNQEAVAFFEDPLISYFRTLETSDIDLVRERQVVLKQFLNKENLEFWPKIVANFELGYLNTEEARLNVAEVALKALQNSDPSVTLYQKLDALKVRQANQARVVDDRLVAQIKRLEDEIDQFEDGQQVGEPSRDNVQENDAVTGVVFDEGGYREIGKNTEGVSLFEDARGVRSVVSGTLRIHEKVAIIPTRNGIAMATPARGESWLTVDESLDAAPAGLRYEDMVRAAFSTRVTADDAHYWHPVAINQGDTKHRYLARARERGYPDGELELINLKETDGKWLAHSELLSPLNELTLGAMPYPAPTTLVTLWENAGFHLPVSGVQNDGSTSNAAGKGANIELEQLNKDADDATDPTQTAGTDAATNHGEPGNVGRAGGLSERPTATGGNPGATNDDLLELGQQPGTTGQSEQPAEQPELPSGAGRLEPTEPVTGADVDAQSDVGNSAGGRGSVGSGSEGKESGTSASGAELPDPTESVSGEPGTGGNTGTVSGRDDRSDPDLVQGTGGGDLFGPGGINAGDADGTDGRPEAAGVTQSDAIAGNPVDSGTSVGNPVGGSAPAVAGTESAVSERVDGGTDSGSGAYGTADNGDDLEQDWLGLGDADAFEDFARVERFYAGSDENPRSPTARLRDNVTAIMRLRELEKSGETPTMEDREVIANYSGFGGIHAKLFNQATYDAPDWVVKANKTLRSLTEDDTLSPTDYESIRKTIINAHYTHSGIIQPMWEALDRFNIPLNRVLEPSAGTLQFKSFMPKELESKVTHTTAVELDPITARIAAMIHPDATVISSGFEKTTFPDGFFDCVISNVPFGDYKIFDPQHPLRKESIHNAFFLKGLDKVRPGGVVSFLTSSYVLDSKDTDVRKEIMDRAHVVGAVRLPTGTFDKTTGTSVVTDILFLQKKGDFEPNYTPLNILDVRTLSAPLGTASSMFIFDEEFQPGEMVPHQTMNQVYVDHPEKILGDLVVMSSQHGAALRVTGGGSVSEQRERLRTAFASLPTDLPSHSRSTLTPAEIAAQVAASNNQSMTLENLPGALSLQGNTIKVNVVTATGAVSTENLALPKSAQSRVAASIIAMTSLSRLMELETTAKSPEEITELDERRQQAKQDATALVRLSDGKKPLSGAGMQALAADARFKLLQGAITVSTDQKWSLADIYSKRTVSPAEGAPESAETLEDALAISLAYTATVSETYMVGLLAHKTNPPTVAVIRTALVEKNLAFIDPVTNQLEERSVYLSGNLRPKIEAVQNIVASDPYFQHNLEALEAALPEPLKPSQIKVGLDAFWIPKDTMKEFLSEGLGFNTVGTFGIQPFFDTHVRHWKLESAGTKGSTSLSRIATQQSHLATSRWGTTRRNAFELLESGFTNTIPKVQDPIPGTEPRRYQMNAPETLKAQNKLEEITDVFNRWIYKSPERASRLADIYNERFNTWVLNDPDGSHMVYPGMSDTFKPYKHQNDFIWRAVSGRNAMTAHVVGAGKTMQLIGASIRGKQMGRWNKPLVVVPNHMLEQFTNDGHKIYPGAKILAMSAADARAVNRPAFAARCAMGDWDMVVCTHSVFEKITIPKEAEARIVDRELRKLREALQSEDADPNGKNQTQKNIEKAIARLQERLERTLADINDNKENVLNLAQIGIDFIGVDEAHYYKNLMLDTSRQIPGVSNASSSRATNMLFKSQYMHELHDGPYGLMMATGTPISNSVTECYTFMRVMRPDLLEGLEIQNFNDWMGLFGEIKHGMEIKPEGGGYHMKSRLSRFKNIPELIKAVRTFIDFKSREDLNLPTPDIIETQVVAKPSPTMANFMKYIEARARTVRAAKHDQPSAAEEIGKRLRAAVYGANNKTLIDKETGEIDPDMIEEPTDDIMLTIATDGRKASLDLRMIHPDLEDFVGSKVNLCVQKCFEMYTQYDEQKAAQLIFCDFSSPTGKGIFNVYDDIKAKLITAGVLENEIAFIHDAKTDADKEKLFAQVRSGEVRFLLGSTQKMGVGTNVQERLIAIHQLDPPWKPSDIEQRLGRMDRQGNMFETAHNFTYVTEDSFDLFMWETLNRKLKMIRQAMQKPEDCARELDEEAEIGYEDILAVTTGNPAIREFLETRVALDKFKRMSDSHTDQQADLASRISIQERTIRTQESYIEDKRKEQATVNDNLPLHIEFSGPTAGLRDGSMCTAGGLDGLTEAIANIAERAKTYREETVGKFGGLDLVVSRMGSEPVLQVKRSHGKAETVFRYLSQQDLFNAKQDAAEAKLVGGTSSKEDKPKDENREAAKDLVRYINKIARSNDIEKSVEVQIAAQENLANLHKDLGQPFAYEDELNDTRKRYEELSVELGDAIDADKTIDPTPLVDFAAQIHGQTGAYPGLESEARSLATEKSFANRAGWTDDDDMGMDEDEDDFNYEEDDDEDRIAIG
ncbi:helicase-related protein [Marinobacter sp. ELB17]|uniref:helicase-related protein n=1 Tax=Marinobacter sp. ELB17 TaxID=270374 RepID=UPI0000F3B3B8|nr:helicase-related protein [Marinobacter sp. ELB17]EAZ98361.1 hypothetical protein MELB17_09048 [Marinobacter sp. ELB17]